jgi:uncharacterized protein HemY
MGTFTVALIIVLLLVVVPILFWILQGIGRLARHRRRGT